MSGGRLKNMPLARRRDDQQWILDWMVKDDGTGLGLLLRCALLATSHLSSWMGMVCGYHTVESERRRYGGLLTRPPGPTHTVSCEVPPPGGKRSLSYLSTSWPDAAYFWASSHDVIDFSETLPQSLFHIL